MGKILERVKEKLGDRLSSAHVFRGDETALVQWENLIVVVRFLCEYSEMDFNLLVDLTAVDYLQFGEARPRFEVVYHLYSIKKNHRLRLKVPVEEKDPVVPSLTSIWPAADWYEREVWDMFGIQFPGHPNLKRIMMYEEFVGHPLRKDYPVNKRQPLIGPKN